jgi:hypothetical protein
MKVVRIFLIGTERVSNEVPPTREAIVFRLDKGYFLSIDFLQQGKSIVEAVVNRYNARAKGQLEYLLENLKEKGRGNRDEN